MNKLIVRYYHQDSGIAGETIVIAEALESLIKVLLSSGYSITEIL